MSRREAKNIYIFLQGGLVQDLGGRAGGKGWPRQDVMSVP